jgi:hypothetical protein
VLVPASLGLRGGTVRGKVIDPAGTVRTFLPLVPCVESRPLRLLEPGERVSSSATVTHGPQGALLPSPGLHRVVVEVRWDDGRVPRAVSGSTTLLVTGATSAGQERAAYGILSTPDTLLAIAATADVGTGVRAIEQAASDPTLGPHYAWLEAKRALRSGAPTDEPYRQALERLAEGDVVLSSAERRRAVEALDRVEERCAVHEESTRRGEVAGADVRSLRELAAAARRRLHEAGRPR